MSGRRVRIGRPSPALVISVLAVVISLTGTAWAVATNSIGTQQVIDDSLKSADLKNGSAVKGADVVDGSVTGADVNEATLSRVGSARKADDVFSTFHDSAKPLPTSLTANGNPYASLIVQQPGSYVIYATLEARDNAFGVGDGGECRLSAGADTDSKHFELNYASSDARGHERYEDIELQVVHTFSDLGTVDLACATSNGADLSALFTKITAVQVDTLTNTQL